MGAWGHKTFENDDAGDWVFALEEVADLSLVRRTLDAAANPEGYLEAPTCSEALAAAEVVAALVGRAGPELPEEVLAWLSAHAITPPPELVVLARAAIDRILADSELKELWEESEEGGAWVSEVQALRGRL
jgi:hypothetical protein